jgi:hypothetical protein
MYPQGAGQRADRYVNDILVEPGVPKILYRRLTLAEVNAGVTLLPALPGFAYTIVAAYVTAIGGAATANTTFDIKGTRGGSAVVIGAFGQAANTRSTRLTLGVTSGATALADAASFTRLDVNTAVTAINVGTAMTTATHEDVILEYFVT